MSFQENTLRYKRIFQRNVIKLGEFKLGYSNVVFYGGGLEEGGGGGGAIGSVRFSFNLSLLSLLIITKGPNKFPSSRGSLIKLRREE